MYSSTSRCFSSQARVVFGEELANPPSYTFATANGLERPCTRLRDRQACHRPCRRQIVLQRGLDLGVRAVQ
jgi:hypothetical protein